MVGLITEFGMPGAAPGSSMVAAGINYVPTSVSAGPVAALVSIAVTPVNPTISLGGTLQLTATGTYSDASTRDLTAQVNWSTTDAAKATIDVNGLVTGVAFGSATIQATQGLTTGTVAVNVFQPTPSPAPPLGRSVSYQIDYAHSGFATFGAPLNFPFAPKWSVTLGGAANYPLIADGRVFVVTGWPGVPTLYALDKATGATVWGPVAVGGTWAGHAYDNGKIFVVERSGNVRAFNAGTGQQLWATQMPLQRVFDSPPTAKDGVVYVTGAGSAGTLFAVDQSNGSVLWSATVWNGGRSSPAVSDDGVFVSYPCQVYKLHPFTGNTLWRYNGPCEGGGGKTAVYANGKLYVRNPGIAPVAPVFDAATGTIVGDFSSESIPAFSTQTGYALSAGTLRAVDLVSGNTAWSFIGDGQLLLAPVVIDNHVIVGSGTGNVYALDAATGTEVWSGNAGAGIVAPDELGGNAMTGFGAGEGYLVVPAGNVVTAWHLSGP
jgi:outer membrane protein assembly factor BamB